MYSAITFTTGDKSLVMPLTALLSQTYRPTEVLIIHDTRWGNPMPPEVERIGNVFRREGIAFKVIPVKESSFAAMKNRGYSFIDNQYVLYIEDDAWIPPNYADELVKQLAFKKTAAIGGCQLLDQQHEDIVDPQEWEKQDLPKEDLYQRMMIDNGKLEYDGTKHQLYRYNQQIIIPAMTLIHTYMMKKKVLDEIGGWDEGAPESGSLMYEESDVFLRMFIIGYNILIHTGLVMWHVREVSARRPTDEIDLEKRKEARIIRKEYFGKKFIGKI